MSIDTTQLHPLDPCTADELTTGVSLLRAADKLSERAFFAFGHRLEPAKVDLLDYAPAACFDRVVRFVGHDPEVGKSFDARVSLSNDELQAIHWIDDGQAPITGSDVFSVYAALAEHSDWLEALARRGIDDPETVHIEPWLAGINPPEMPDGRVLRAIAFLKVDGDTNYYARPIDGLVVLVDVDSAEVLVIDEGAVPIPGQAAEYTPDRVGPLRDDLKALDITQPDGPSFTVDGHVISWQKWHIRISVDPIEGLVLHDVRYRDGDRDRSILYRAALSDMVVPYGDSSILHYWKHAFDAGETSLGHQANSLKLGCDCLGEIYYFDATLLGNDGEPYVVDNAICLHEEDFGILWKHTNPFDPDQPPEVRRSRRLVVSMIHTVGNYEYGFYWYFYLDGTIQLEVKLTGIIGVSAAPDGLDSDTSPLVGPNVSSPIHQHLFCVRLDMALDGPSNSIIETNVEMAPGDHPYGAGFRAVPTPLRTEQEAMRQIDPAHSRSWKVTNPTSHNALGQPVAYKLLPQASPHFMVPEDSPAGGRGGFARHNLWVTPYDENERHAGAGAFTNLHPGNDVGLPTYVQANRAIEDTDIVVWHTFGVTHVPRPEDWPIMPVEYAGFSLVANGFFDQNPSLDVPPSEGGACHT